MSLYMSVNILVHWHISYKLAIVLSAFSLKIWNFAHENVYFSVRCFM